MLDGAQLSPSVPLEPGERIVHSFRPDSGVYLRDMTWMAAIAMAAGMLILWLTANPHVWTGAVGGLAAIGLRAWYLRSEEMATRWDLTDRRLLGPGGRAPQLADIVRINRFASSVQVVTAEGDKHLIKYQPNRDDTSDRIRRAVVSAGGTPG